MEHAHHQPNIRVGTGFPAKRPSQHGTNHDWPAVSLPSPVPSVPPTHDRHAVAVGPGHPFPTPPASACGLKPSPSCLPVLLPTVSDHVSPLVVGRDSGLTGSMNNRESSSSPPSPDSSPLRLPETSWSKIRELTERRRVQGLAAKRNYRHRLEQESRRKLLEERGCASDTELDDSKPAICWQAEIAVAHPKPVSQFKRLAFLDLEDDLLLDGPYDVSRLTPSSEDTRPAVRHQLLVKGGRDSVVPELPTPVDGGVEPVSSLERALGFAATHDATVAEPIAPSNLVPISNAQESSESLSVTSMSCDYDTTASEDEGRLGSRAERKRILLERLMRYFHSIFAACPQQTRTHGGNDTPPTGRGGGLNTGQRSRGGGNASGGARRQQEGRKRPPEDEDGDDEGDGSDRKRPRRHDNTDEAPLRLACPYFKKSPRRYRLSRSCPGPGWSTVHRVKEHLYRCHRLPIHCLYCHEKFDSDKLLQVHLRADRACKGLDLPPLEGIDAVQEKLLRSRKKSHKDWTEADKWRDAYRILFPEDDPANVPSPYYDYEQGADAEQESDPSEIARYEQYLRRELPNRVREALEARIDEALNPIEETLRDQIVEIVRDSQLHLFERYKLSRTDTAQVQTAFGLTPTLSDGSPPDPEAGVGQGLHMLDDELQLYRPEPYFDQQFDDLNGNFFEFMQIQLGRDWDDSGYGSCSVAETLSPDALKDKGRAE